jgi:alpha-tubulin suppressor-like RCC1 family protein
MGQLSVDQAISRIKTLQSELLEIESKISEAVKGARLDYEQQLRGAKPGPKNEFESTAEFQRRVEVANERIERVRQDEDKAVDDIRVQFSKDLEEIRRMLKTLLNGEYPASNGKVNVELGQYDADKKEMAVLVRWTSFGKKYEANGYLRIESNDAKRLRDRQEFLTIKGYLKILPNVLKITLSRVEIFYGAENEWSTQVRWNNLRDIIAISVGKRYSTEPGYFLALKSDGTVWGWRQERPIQVPGLPNIKAMGVGPYHHLAVSDDGTVWGWGKNDWGQLGTRKEKYRPSPVQIPGLSHVIAIGAGENHSVALKDDGTVWAWGRNDVGQLGDGTIGRGATVTKDSPVQVSGLINITAISAGWEHNLALKGDGTVWGWGKNYNGEVGDGASGGVRETPVKLTGLSHVKGISAGIWSSMALKSDGTVWFWGQDTNGQNRTIPTLVSGLTKMMKIFTGSRSNLVLGTDGLVWAWGTLYNRRQSSPQVVSSLADVVDISAWEGDILALKDDGTVWSLKEQPVQILAPLSE